MKSKAVISKDQLTAKAVWCLETIGRIQDHFVSAFLYLKTSEFKEAWDQFERCEFETSFLDSHFTEERGEFGIEYIRTHTRQFQELFPFTAGISPAFLREDVRCSICDTRIGLRSGCEHIVDSLVKTRFEEVPAISHICALPYVGVVYGTETVYRIAHLSSPKLFFQR